MEKADEILADGDELCKDAKGKSPKLENIYF